MNNDNLIKKPRHDPRENLHLKSDSSIVIGCGESSIILHHNGTIEIKGKDLIMNGHTIQLTGLINLN